MHINDNLTYYGFYEILGSKDIKLEEQFFCSCSMGVRNVSAGGKYNDSKKVVVYAPNDWLHNTFRNKDFMKFWAETMSKFFSEVTYDGLVEHPNGIDNIKKLVGQEGQYAVLNKGDYLYKNLFRKFTIKVDNTASNYAFRTYATFCMIRYLYCTNFHGIVLNFIKMKRYALQKQLGVTPDDFQIMQMSHMIENPLCYFFYGKAFNTASFNTNGTAYTPDAYIPKFVTLDYVKNNLVKANAFLNGSFKTTNSNLKQAEFNKDFANQAFQTKIKQLYEAMS